MLTLIHAPMSRSSRVLWLIDELGIESQVDVKLVDIVRYDGSGRSDPANPHPEHKVPVLFHGDAMFSETGAILLYLTALFPKPGLAPKPGSVAYGAFLTWMFWYGSVMEPALILSGAGISHPYITAAIRGVPEINTRLQDALSKGPWILGQDFSAADMLLHSPYSWFAEALPDDPLICDWVARCQARPSVQRTRAKDQAWLATTAQ